MRGERCSRSGLPWPTESVTDALTNAPKTATPIALPTVRANIVAPVVTARDCQPTADWAAITAGATAKPKPKPITKHGSGQVQQRASRRRW